MVMCLLGCQSNETRPESKFNLPYVGTRTPITESVFENYGTRELIYQETKSYGEIVRELWKLQKTGDLALSSEQEGRIIFKILRVEGIQPNSRIIVWKNMVYDPKIKDSKPGNGVVIQFWLADAPGQKEQ